MSDKLNETAEPLIAEELERVGLEDGRTETGRIRGIYPRLIWPHLDSHQLFVRINVDGKEVEAELSVGGALQWLEIIAKFVARMVRQ